MSDRLERWAPGTARRLRALDEAADDALAAEAREALAATRRAIPRRTGRMQASLLTRRAGDRHHVESTHPGALHLDTGGTIVARRSRYLLIPIEGSYRRGSGAYVALASPSGTRVVVPRERGDRIAAILADRVTHRPTGYLTRAAKIHQRDADRRVQRALDRVLGVR